MNYKTKVIVCVCLLMICGFLWWPKKAVQRTPFGGNSFRLEAFQPVTAIPYSFPAIESPRYVKAESSIHNLKDDELVLGIAIGTESRAYPINMMSGPDREIVNDQMEGTHFAATW